MEDFGRVLAEQWLLLRVEGILEALHTLFWNVSRSSSLISSVIPAQKPMSGEGTFHLQMFKLIAVFLRAQRLD